MLGFTSDIRLIQRRRLHPRDTVETRAACHRPTRTAQPHACIAGHLHHAAVPACQGFGPVHTWCVSIQPRNLLSRRVRPPSFVHRRPARLGIPFLPGVESPRPQSFPVRRSRPPATGPPRQRIFDSRKGVRVLSIQEHCPSRWSRTKKPPSIGGVGHAASVAGKSRQPRYRDRYCIG